MKHFLETGRRWDPTSTSTLSATTEWILMGITTALVFATIILAYGRFAKTHQHWMAIAATMPIPKRSDRATLAHR
jgi:hypothetical protein